jgi:hypothetical protein
MKTRILELAMSRKITTVHDYAKLLGIDDDRAELILKGQLELSEPEIQKNCEFFHCSRDYLLCYKDIDD